jgi:hypothetical protein
VAWFDWRLAVRMAAPVEAGGISPVDGWMQDMDRPIPMEPRRVGRVERPRRTGARGQDPGLDPEVRRPQRGEVRGGSTWRCNIKHATAARLRTTADLRLRKYTCVPRATLRALASTRSRVGARSSEALACRGIVAVKYVLYRLKLKRWKRVPSSRRALRKFASHMPYRIYTHANRSKV